MAATIPCEDIGVVIVDQLAVTYTHAVLTTLMRFGAVLIVCGGDHHPVGMAWPFDANTLHTERLRLQVEMTRPRGKRIWQQLVAAKVRAQAAHVRGMTQPFEKLTALADRVTSGDPGNVEAQAAKIYWQALFPDGSFRRDPEGAPPNDLLNYGYMALRAAVARAICVAGLHPSIGFHHRNRYNPFCLADDLMEPFRPLADARAIRLWRGGTTSLDKQTKAELLAVLAERVALGDETGPLMVALTRMMGSLIRVLEGGEKKLEIPAPCF